MRTYPLRDVSRWIGKDPRTLRRWGFGAELTHAELFEACDRAGLKTLWYDERKRAFYVGLIWFSLDHHCGDPCIIGRGLSTKAVFDRFMAGEDILALRHGFQLSAVGVEAAIRWEAKR